ncbi:MAG: amidohydrolase [Chloroflexi bacterium]|nr:amidohydrolase [Chloroflexota bacterium]MBV9597345.1 amidohydrolase [Chloroflexota bacterium]
MPVIDADTHVTEGDDAFAYLRDSELQFAPIKGEVPARNGGSPRGYWLVGGQQMSRRIQRDGDVWKTMGELLDVDARLRAMDDMGVDTQVIYPTFFNKAVGSSMGEAALARSYNRWMADRCGKSGGRLRWVAVPALQSIQSTIEEMRFAKEHGAVGVLKKGDEEAGYWPAEPYFFPVYEEAERLDLPMCFHVGSGYTGMMPLERLAHMTQHKFHLSHVSAFCSLITFQIPDKFPNLRWGFIEVTASWVPYALYYMRRILTKSVTTPGVASSVAGSTTYQVPRDVLSRNRMYVSCFVDEDLPRIIEQTGEDNLLMGSDFVHHDHATELDFVGALQQRVDRGELSATFVRKLTYDNPRTFYGL